ncbi:MAG: hypothetical protein M1837_004137 [Sclerophora amabilis]|nr:MAG: hypothetical protein M1837_004137 [Sclerophora amabilis]
MSSGFVPAGSTEDPVRTNDEWEKAKLHIEDARRRREEGQHDDGKSLFDVLQQNKAAKQEAFEESIRLKNQFRSLDEDEVEFLDSVLESTRAQEEAVKKETTEQLGIFRRQQEEADKARLADEPVTSSETGGGLDDGEEQWVTTGRKRKKGKEKEALRGFKLRKSSSTSEKPGPQEIEATNPAEGSHKGPETIQEAAVPRSLKASAPQPVTNSPKDIQNTKVPSNATESIPGGTKPATTLLGLTYSSDEEED